MTIRAQVVKAAEEHGWEVRETKGHSFLVRDGAKAVIGWRTDNVLSYAQVNGKRIGGKADQVIEELEKK